MTGNRTDLPTTVDLAVLTPRQRLVVTLHYFDNWTEQEIAEALGQASVRTLHARALSRLKQHFSANPLRNCTYR
jgi:DNA-directed RNA polymerase specialized sigma24 family protein